MTSLALPSPAVRLAQIFFAVLSCLLCAGVVYGFAALKPVLIQQGVYSDFCLPGERWTTDEGAWIVCKDQDTRLNLVFTLAVVLSSAVYLPIGICVDRVGPRATCIAGTILFALGNLIFGWGYRSAFFDSYIIGFILLGIGGPLIYLPQFHLSNTFPAFSGAILASISGAFDASAITYAFYRAGYDASGGVLSLRKFFWWYTLIPAGILVEQLLLAPSATYMRLLTTDIEQDERVEPVGDEAVDPLVAAAGSSFSRVSGELKKAERDHKAPDPMVGLLYGQSATEQLKSKWFILLMLFIGVQMTRLNFYLMTVDAQLESFTRDRPLSETLTTLFTVLLPIGGIIGIPPIGFLLDHRPTFDVFGVLTAMGIAFGILGVSSSGSAQTIGIVVFCLFRPLLYTANSDTFAKIFGFETFGTVFGLAMTISGLLGLLNSPFDYLVKEKFGGSFLELDVILLVVGGLVCGSLMLAIWRENRKGTIQLEEE